MWGGGWRVGGGGKRGITKVYYWGNVKMGIMNSPFVSP